MLHIDIHIVIVILCHDFRPNMGIRFCLNPLLVAASYIWMTPNINAQWHPILLSSGI